MTVLFSEMLHDVKGISDYVQAVATLPPERKEAPLDLLFRDPEIAVLANALVSAVPLTRQNAGCETKSYEKVRLTGILEEIRQLEEGWPSGTRVVVPPPQPELEDVEIWSFRCTENDLFSRSSYSYSYLDLFLDELHHLKSISEIDLRACHLSGDGQSISMDLEWRGPFESVEYITIPRLSRRLWRVICNSGQLDLSLNLMRAFFYLQVSAAWGPNGFGSAQISKEGRLKVRLQLLQAIAPEPPGAQPLSETAWQSVSDYIVQQCYSRYVDASQKLELKLGEELERRKQYTKQGILEGKYVDQLREWMRNLAQLRQAYFQEISSAK